MLREMGEHMEDPDRGVVVASRSTSRSATIGLSDGSRVDGVSTASILIDTAEFDVGSSRHFFFFGGGVHGSLITSILGDDDEHAWGLTDDPRKSRTTP